MSLSLSTKKQGHFYIPEEFQETLKKFMKIIEREGKTPSEWIREHISNYVQLHEPGNPQQTLTFILEHGKAYIAKSPKDCKFWHNRKNPTKPYVAFCSFQKNMISLDTCQLCGRWKT